MASPSPVPRSPLVVKNGSRQRRRVSSSMPMPVSATSTCDHARAASGRACCAACTDAAVGHGVDGIEDEIGQRLADFAFDAHDRRQVVAPVRCSISITTPRCCGMSRQRARVRSSTCCDERVQLDRRQRELRLALAIEFAHARDGARHVLDGALHDLELAAAGLGSGRARCSSSDSV